METHPSSTMLAAKLHLIRRVPCQVSLLAVLAYFFLLDREVALQVATWLLVSGPRPGAKQVPSWSELRMILSAPRRAAAEKPALSDGLGHRLRGGARTLPGLGKKLSLPYQQLAQIRAWSYYLVEWPMGGLPKAWVEACCCSTTLAACLYQLPNCGPYLAARALGWLCKAGLLGFTGGCLGPGAVMSLHHLLAGDSGPGKTPQRGEWPWTAPQLHELTRQLAAAAGVGYWDTQGALCLWMQLDFGTKLPACQNKLGSASPPTPPQVPMPTMAPSSPPPRVEGDSPPGTPPPRPPQRRQQPEDQQQDKQQDEQHHPQQIATSNPGAAEAPPEETGQDPAPREAACSSTKPGELDTAPALGSCQDHAAERGRCSSSPSEAALVAEPVLTRATHQELETWMARVHGPDSESDEARSDFQHAARFGL
jgi:hypothetical protein